MISQYCKIGGAKVHIVFNLLHNLRDKQLQKITT